MAILSRFLYLLLVWGFIALPPIAGLPVDQVAKAAEVRLPAAPPLVNQQVSIDFGNLPFTLIEPIATTEANLKAWQSLAQEFRLKKLFATESLENLAAFTSLVFPLRHEISFPKAHTIAVEASLWAAPYAADATIKAAFSWTDNLEYRRQVLQNLTQLTAKARVIIAKAKDLPLFTLDAKQNSQHNLEQMAQQELPQSLQQESAQKSQQTFQQDLQQIIAQINADNLFLATLKHYQESWTNPKQAIQLLQAVFEQQPKHTLALVALAEAQMLNKNFFNARETLELVSAQESFPAKVYYLRGVVNANLHLPTYALQDFNQAIVADKTKPAWWRARGAIKLHLQQDDYCEDFKQACLQGECAAWQDARQQNNCLNP